MNSSLNYRIGSSACTSDSFIAVAAFYIVADLVVVVL